MKLVQSPSSPSIELKRSAAVQKRNIYPEPADAAGDALTEDLRWDLTQRVATGPHFARSALLPKFLLYVVSETLAGRPEAISEQKIGVAVFGRPAGYNTDDDNIVRNYARQLRKRLAVHFAGIGRSEPIHIEIRVGGYIPSFIERHQEVVSPIASLTSMPPPIASAGKRGASSAQEFLKRKGFGLAFVVILLGAAIAGVAWSRMNRERWRVEPDMNRVLWKSILTGSSNTLVVPSDTGFNLLEDMAHQSFPLESYIKGTYGKSSSGRLNQHADRDLHTQEYTDLVSMQIAVDLARQPDYDPHRVLLRFPRDIKISDLKTSNVLIIGSASANPWAGLVERGENFHIVPSSDMEGAQILNAAPLPGEAPAYASHWNEPAHDTYALILFLPNLSAGGHILVIEGLDVAGTQAASELLFHPGPISAVLHKAMSSDGNLRPFEILVRSNSIDSNAAGTQIIASRIH